MVMAGLDGIRNQIDPGDGEDRDLFELPAEELAKIATVPPSLNGALEALNADRGFLTAGGVFSDDFIDNWIDLKYEEVQQLRQRPHPHEFTMYYDACSPSLDIHRPVSKEAGFFVDQGCRGFQGHSLE